MTRRDHCAKCKEMVHDCDVKCVNCLVSLCHGCATSYDPVSRMCLLQAKNKVLCNPTFGSYETRILIEDLESGFWDSGEGHECDIQSLLESWRVNQDTALLLSKLNDIVGDDLDFVCNMCHQGIDVVY